MRSLGAFPAQLTPPLVARTQDFPLGSPPGSSLGPPAVRVFNSPSNVHDAGKHFACAMATYDTCYFNDDDWLNVVSLGSPDSNSDRWAMLSQPVNGSTSTHCTLSI